MHHSITHKGIGIYRQQNCDKTQTINVKCNIIYVMLNKQNIIKCLIFSFVFLKESFKIMIGETKDLEKYLYKKYKENKAGYWSA